MCKARQLPSVELEPVVFQENLTYEKKPLRILDSKLKILRNKVIKYVKVLWDAQTEEMTWEVEEKINESYPQLFEGQGNFQTLRTKFLLRGGRM